MVAPSYDYPATVELTVRAVFRNMDLRNDLDSSALTAI